MKSIKLTPDRIYKDGPFIFATGTIDIKVHRSCNPDIQETLTIAASEAIQHDDGTLELIDCKIVKAV